MLAFSVAARQLGSTPSTVSRQIKRLEEAPATRLLERSTRKVRATESVRRCMPVLPRRGERRVGGDGCGRSPGGPAARPGQRERADRVCEDGDPSARAGFPCARTRRSISSCLFTDHEVDPLDDDLDLVIRLDRAPPPGLAGRRLGTVRWVLCARRLTCARAARRRIRASLQHDCLYLGETADDNRRRFRSNTETQTVEVRGRYIANRTPARGLRRREGFGVANLPDFAAAGALQRGELVQVLADWELQARAYVGSVWLLYPPNRFLPPKVRVLIDYLAEHIGGGG
ncbi:LysR family transcriptional regulator [Cupriavidus basilensis]